MSAKTIKGLLRKPKWTGEELGIAKTINWIYTLKLHRSNDLPIAIDLIHEHEQLIIHNPGACRHHDNYANMINWLQSALQLAEVHKVQLYGSLKIVFSTLQKLIVLDMLREYIGQLKEGADLPAPVKTIALEGYLPGTKKYIANTNDIKAEYSSIKESLHFIYGFNTLIEDILQSLRIKELAFLKIDTDYIKIMLDVVNKEIAFLRDHLKKCPTEHIREDKQKILKEYFRQIRYEQLNISPEYHNQGKALIDDFTGFIPGNNELYNCYCEVHNRNNRDDKNEH